jgi:hypothetical protein
MSDILNEATNAEEEMPSNKRMKVAPSQSSTSSLTHSSTTSITVSFFQANSLTSSASLYFIPSIHFTGCLGVTVNFTINKPYATRVSACLYFTSLTIYIL